MLLGNSNAYSEALSELLDALAADEQGDFSPSCYETARLVSLAPTLSGHQNRVRFLLDTQRSDGAWGGPENYALLPTLSAVEALLTIVDSDAGDAPRTDVTTSVERGLLALRRDLTRYPSLPDTVAIEVLVPALTELINARLERLGDAGTLSRQQPLPGHPDSTPGLTEKLRTMVRTGHALPSKLLHSLEVIGQEAGSATLVEPVSVGCVGCSPAATAAWLGDRVDERTNPAVRYLESVLVPATGAVPVAAPLALFERAWILSTLANVGMITQAPSELIASLHAGFDADGAAGGLGLPPDVDDTAAALYALAKLGSPRSPEPLWAYQADAHFRCFPAERTPSTSANAHVLQALGASLRPDLPDRARYATAMGRLTSWLVAQQDADGSWFDKWHASPFYATLCCVEALQEFGTAASDSAVRRAIDWVLANQRDDGSWGHWEPTTEETAYAVRMLLQTNTAIPSDIIETAAAKGCAALLKSAVDRSSAASPRWMPDPPLWHDKDLYTPARIVWTEKLAALYLADRRPRVAELTSEFLRRPTKVAIR